MKNKILSYLLGGIFVLFVGFIGNVYASCDTDCIERIQPGDELTKCLNVCEAKGQGGKSCEELLSLYPGYICCKGTLMLESFGCEEETEEETCPGGCCGIKLNTDFPIIGNCIETKAKGTNATNAFPTMMGALTKIIMSVILVVCFIMIIVAGILWSANKPKDAKELLKKVAITILLLGFSGVILKLVNPNFFG